MIHYFISDEHYGSIDIGRYSNRNYSFDMEGAIKMDDDLLSLYNSLPDYCTIWNLGDVFWFDNKELVNEEFARSIVSRMKGRGRRINLVLGNHDDQTGHYGNCIDFYKSLGFNEVYDGITTIGNYILSHKPVYIPLGSPKINIHGHTHQFAIKPEYFTYEYDNYEMIKVFCDVNNIDFPPLECKSPEKIIDPSHYINVSYDYKKGFTEIDLEG